MKDIKGITVINAFHKFLNDPERKPNKIWVAKGIEFYNRSVKSWLQDNDIEMYSTGNDENFLTAGRFIRTVKNKIYKYVTSVSKNVYIDELADIVNEYNSAYHSIIKMNPLDVMPSTYIDFDKENNN